mmetsp:Transcript_80880/g.251133  ORF Transcript_80880/g.251133 Transcript_80880/m.251133 type:complete len:203 (-) Transcript_80880:1175-1783(-)
MTRGNIYCRGWMPGQKARAELQGLSLENKGGWEWCKHGRGCRSRRGHQRRWIQRGQTSPPFPTAARVLSRARDWRAGFVRNRMDAHDGGPSHVRPGATGNHYEQRVPGRLKPHGPKTLPRALLMFRYPKTAKTRLKSLLGSMRRQSPTLMPASSTTAAAACCEPPATVFASGAAPSQASIGTTVSQVGVSSGGRGRTWSGVG